jgi:hypothetical protein
MDKLHLVQVGTRILNLDAVRYMDVQGADLVKVFFTESESVEFVGNDARSLLKILAEYIHRDPTIEAARATREFLDSIKKPVTASAK